MGCAIAGDENERLTVNIFKRWKPAPKPTLSRDPAGYIIEVKCDRCQEIVRTRINLYNDLSLVGSDEINDAVSASYVCNKTLMGSGHCFQRIQVKLLFDQNRKLVGKQIEEGTFLENQA